MRHKAALLWFLIAGCGSAGDLVASDAAPSIFDAAPEPLVDAEPGLPDAPPPVQDVVVGSSITGYAPLEDGTLLAVHMGPQGGFHVYLTLRSRGIVPGGTSEAPRLCTTVGTFMNPCVTFQVTDATTGTRYDAYTPLRLPLTLADDGSGSFDLVPPRLVPLAIRSLAEIEGVRLRVRVAVDDRAGVHAESSVVVTAQAAR